MKCVLNDVWFYVLFSYMARTPSVIEKVEFVASQHCMAPCVGQTDIKITCDLDSLSINHEGTFNVFS